MNAPALAEFDVIARYFKRAAQPLPPAVLLGVGDDCALLQSETGQALAVSTDTLVEGVHFLADVAPEALGHKALAVNLSDLAAMGARPLGFTLALTLPEVRPDWLADFARGLFALADASACPLVGGDTTRGPLAIGITVLGQVAAGQALRRSGAKLGDGIYISGSGQAAIGQAAVGLALRLGQMEAASLTAEDAALALARLERPTPRLALGQALRGLAHAALDVSDGLLGDVAHMATASGLRAELSAPALQALAASRPVLRALPPEQALRLMATGGDDYELLLAAPPEAEAALHKAAAAQGLQVWRVGQMVAGQGVALLDAAGRPLSLAQGAYQHFAP